MKLYGIKNCNTVQKALAWLKENKVDVDFHDYKKEGVSEEKLQQWSNQLGWEPLLNKRGTTWKKLDTDTQAGITTQAAAFKLMKQNTSVIKRPVIEDQNGRIIVGFEEGQLTEFVKGNV